MVCAGFGRGSGNLSETFMLCTGSEALIVELSQILQASSQPDGLSIRNAMLLAIQAFTLLADGAQLTSAYGGQMLSEEQTDRLRASLQMALLKARPACNTSSNPNMPWATSKSAGSDSKLMLQRMWASVPYGLESYIINRNYGK